MADASEQTDAKAHLAILLLLGGLPKADFVLYDGPFNRLSSNLPVLTISRNAMAVSLMAMH